jgi:predicted RNA polymerase sigma factor
VRRHGNFDTAEDALQEARVAGRRLTDLLRAEQSRRRREATVGRWAVTDAAPDRGWERDASDSDDTLILMVLCCHPSLSVASQIALTLRAAGPDLQRTELTTEAIRLTRIVHAALPGDSEVTGLLALMLLIHARHRARTGPDGALIPMADQDRTRWDARVITRRCRAHHQRPSPRSHRGLPTPSGDRRPPR